MENLIEKFNKEGVHLNSLIYGSNDLMYAVLKHRSDWASGVRDKQYFIDIKFKGKTGSAASYPIEYINLISGHQPTISTYQVIKNLVDLFEKIYLFGVEDGKEQIREPIKFALGLDKIHKI